LNVSRHEYTRNGHLLTDLGELQATKRRTSEMRCVRVPAPAFPPEFAPG
jgi:hypothetical protein